MSDSTRPPGYDWEAALAATGLADEVEPRGEPPPTDVGAQEGARILLHIRTLGRTYSSQYDRRWVELRAAAQAAIVKFAARAAAWDAVFLASFAEADRAARYAERAQIGVQGHLAAPARYTATVDGVRYVLASEDVCALPGALHFEDEPAIVDGVPTPTPTVAFKQLATAGVAALQATAKEPGREGRQVEVQIIDGSTALPARITGDAATFGGLALDELPGVLTLTVSGVDRPVMFPTGAASSAAAYAAAINAQLAGYVRAAEAPAGRLTLETIATGPAATLDVLRSGGVVQAPARLLGDEAGFAAVPAGSTLDLYVNGSSPGDLHTLTFNGTQTDRASWCAAILVQLGTLVRALPVSTGDPRITIETRATGPTASLTVGGGSTPAVLASLGLTSGQTAAGATLNSTPALLQRIGMVSTPGSIGETTFTLGVRRGTLYEESYPDLDRTSPGYASALLAIGRTSLLLGSVEVVGTIGARRPDNTAGWIGLTGTAGGAGAVKSALARRLARAQKLPAVTGNPDLARALKVYADAYAKAAVLPKYDDAGAPYDGGFIAASTFPEVDPAKYTVLAAENKLRALIAEGAVWVALRRFHDPIT